MPNSSKCVWEKVLNFIPSQLGFTVFTVHKQYRDFSNLEISKGRLSYGFNLDFIGVAVQIIDDFSEKNSGVATIAAGAVFKIQSQRSSGECVSGFANEFSWKGPAQDFTAFAVAATYDYGTFVLLHYC